MKVLFIHNKYGRISGEELMIESIMSLLKSNGHEVMLYSKDSSDIVSIPHKIKAFLSGIWSFSSRLEVGRILDQFDPDVVQIQNLYPLISGSILGVIKRKKIPIVMRLSNYRLVCPTGLLLSENEICTRCVGGKEYWCALKNCENNIFRSTGYALRSWFGRYFGLYSKNVTAYYAQTDFQRNVLASDRYKTARIEVISNMVANPVGVLLDHIGSYVAFAGRVSEEKGFGVFIDAARILPKVNFKVAGHLSRPFSSETFPDNVQYLGHLKGEALEEFYRGSRMLIVPSLWYEGFPSVAIQAMMLGKPVIASRIGGLPEIVVEGQTGLLFEPGDVSGLTEAITKLWNDEGLVRRLGLEGRSRSLVQYSKEVYYEKLVALYASLVK